MRLYVPSNTYGIPPFRIAVRVHFVRHTKRRAAMKYLIGALCLLLTATSHAQEKNADQPDALSQAAAEFAHAVANTAQTISHDPYYNDDKNRAAGMAHWARMMIRTLEEDVILDADF